MSSPEHDARMAVADWLAGALGKNSYTHNQTVLDGEFYLTGIAGAMIDDWGQLNIMIQPALAARREAARQAQRDAGQVWWLVYKVRGKEKRDECFSLAEAQAVAVALIDNQTGWPTRIEQPNGPTITGNQVWERFA